MESERCKQTSKKLRGPAIWESSFKSIFLCWRSRISCSWSLSRPSGSPRPSAWPRPSPVLPPRSDRDLPVFSCNVLSWIVRVSFNSCLFSFACGERRMQSITKDTRENIQLTARPTAAKVNVPHIDPHFVISLPLRRTAQKNPSATTQNLSFVISVNFASAKIFPTIPYGKTKGKEMRGKVFPPYGSAPDSSLTTAAVMVTVIV